MDGKEYSTDPYNKALVATQLFSTILTSDYDSAKEYIDTLASEQEKWSCPQSTNAPYDEEQEKLHKLYAIKIITADLVRELGNKQNDEWIYTALDIWATCWNNMITQYKNGALPASYQVVIDSMQKKVELTDRDHFLRALPSKDSQYQHKQLKLYSEKSARKHYKVLVNLSPEIESCIEIIRDLLVFCYGIPVSNDTTSHALVITMCQRNIRQYFDSKDIPHSQYRVGDLIKALIVCKVNDDKTLHPYYNLYQGLLIHYNGKPSRGNYDFKSYLQGRFKKHWDTIAESFYYIIEICANKKQVAEMHAKLDKMQPISVGLHAIGAALGVASIVVGILVYPQYFFPLVSAGSTVLVLALSSLLIDSVPSILGTDYSPLSSINLGSNNPLDSSIIELSKHNDTTYVPKYGI